MRFILLAVASSDGGDGIALYSVSARLPTEDGLAGLSLLRPLTTCREAPLTGNGCALCVEAILWCAFNTGQ